MIRRSFLYVIFLIFLFVQISSVYELGSEKKFSEEWNVKETDIRFLSEAPQETIRGSLKKAEGKADLKSKTFFFQVDLNDLNVPNRLMNRHMHENYLETERFPNVIFQGNISKWDVSSKTVIVEGNITLHGVTKKNVQVRGNFEEKGKDLLIRANFEILLSDFNIEIPKLVILKLNEKIRIETSVTWQTKE
ncbi:YceI family protein [Leptospira borgpetersenii]|uniref:YceI family protein n=1 Tax=Leptospira borgpetersenii TaxID=174 RepID=UPI0007733BE0|nr:YceI family protein [Leptospira borgpetersenii]MBE8364671.1 YceI family protein [Leptospira borgpetersenii serovar Balcanica]MBE8366189.1 YceI family protein [Leptospira borgpetersenii serovar Balcanica]MBE8423745.1 YceI family protein [Leptospira borgpetersenii serovar Balcanica]MBF3350883.1 YceI family protein [Leptospira borgpetersenii serovar Balcanica]MBF3377202.1 YceI family protein [Leptospira borgpetersenii serovar Balcanica]